jgi:hypothetical protein
MAVTIALRCILELVIRFLAPDHFAAKNVNIQYRACLTKKEQSALKAFFLPVHELLAKDSYALFSLLFVAKWGCPPRNRLSPRYINIAHNRYNIGSKAGQTAQACPKENTKERKEELIPKGLDQRKRNVVAPAENSHHAPSTRKPHVPSITFKKGCDDAAATRSGPRVSPVRARTGKHGSTQRHSRRKGGAREHHCVSVGETDMDFSQPS